MLESILEMPRLKRVKVTLKSILHFISLAHITLGIIFWYFLMTLLDTIIHRSTKSNVEGFLMGIQYFFYLFLFLPIGYLIYRGIKKESVPILQWATLGFLLIQLYGLIIQIQHEFLISTFFAVTFLQDERAVGGGGGRGQDEGGGLWRATALELTLVTFTSLLYGLLILLYIRQLKSHFYVPPIYPCRVEYFYYPHDTTANVHIFHRQVPSQILENYQNSAYFSVQSSNSVQHETHYQVINKGDSSSGGGPPQRPLHNHLNHNQLGPLHHHYHNYNSYSNSPLNSLTSTTTTTGRTGSGSGASSGRSGQPLLGGTGTTNKLKKITQSMLGVAAGARGRSGSEGSGSRGGVGFH